MRVYRASGLGGCMKAQIAQHLEYRAIDTSKQMANMGKEGELHENAVVQDLKYVHMRQHEVMLELSPAFDVVGHIDGIYHDLNGEDIHDPGPFILEVKSMGKEPFRNWKARGWDTSGLVQRYKWQVSAYMIATQLPCMFIVKNRDSGEVDRQIIMQPFYTREQIFARVLDMERWVRKGELPGACDVNMFPCPYFYLEEQDAADLSLDDVIDELAQMYEDERLAEKVAKGRKADARKALDTGMGTRDRVSTEKCQVTYYQSKRKALDVAKMEEELGKETVDRFYKETISKGLRVTIKETDDGTDQSRGDDAGKGTDTGSLRDSEEAR